MDEVLLDTNVFSYLLRRDDTRADLYRLHVQHRTAVVSFVTVGELYYWAERKKWGRQRLRNLEAHLHAAAVVPYDLEICKTYARIKSGLKTSSGSHRLVGDNDLWIAACAVRHSMPLITHNRRHFAGIPDLNVISEAP
jgi:predicted nucleic acid-binding protein